MPLHPDIQALREHIKTMRPNPCCVAKPMRENNGKVTMCCDDHCPWSKLEMLIAVVSINLKDPPYDLYVGDWLRSQEGFGTFQVKEIQERRSPKGKDQTDVLLEEEGGMSGRTLPREVVFECYDKLGKCGDIDDRHVESICRRHEGHQGKHKDDFGNEW